MNEDFNNNNELKNNIVDNAGDNLKDLNNNVKNGKNSNIKLVIIVVCIVIVLLILGVVFCFGFNKDSKNDNFYINDKNIIFKDISFFELPSSYVDIKAGYEFVYYDNYIIDNDNLYDYDGNLIFDSSDYDSVIYNNIGFITVEKNGKYGLLDNNFNLVLPIEYDKIDVYSEQCIFVSRLNKNNRYITDIIDLKRNKRYEDFIGVHYISDKFIIAKKYKLGNNEDAPSSILDTDLDNYVINLKDETQLLKKTYNTEFVNLSDTFNDTFVIYSIYKDDDFKYGVINSDFDTVINFEYTSIDNINNEFLLLNKKDLITIDNKHIFSVDNVYDIYVLGEIIYVTLNDKSTLYYDKNGNLLFSSNNYTVPKQLNNVKYLVGNYTDTCVLLDSKNKETNSLNNSYCSFMLEDDKILIEGNNYIIKNENNGYSLYDTDLNLVFDNLYDGYVFFDNFCLVEKSNYYYIYSYNEDKLIDMSFDSFSKMGNGIVLKKNDKIYYFEYKK